MLWEKYPQFHEMGTFTTLDALLEEHEHYQEDFTEELREEYETNGYENFLIQLSWSDLPYRYKTMQLLSGSNLDKKPEGLQNRFISDFIQQFDGIDTDHKAVFLFPESYVSQFFVVMEVCKKAEELRTIKPIFPDEEKIHYLVVFDKEDMDSVMLMFHLLYSSGSEDLFGGYSLYDYPLGWYQTHLWQDGTVLRSPFLPDKLAKFQGNVPFYHNPAKTVYVRRNIDHILECGYVESELEFWLELTTRLMPMLQWWYTDLEMYETKDGVRTPWRLERTKIRTELTASGVIRPKWKHELSLFHLVHELYPDTLYQYRPEWLGRQSLDLYIPSLNVGIEYQGVQHYRAVEFFGGEEALVQRQELDTQKAALCKENGVRLIEWPYDIEPTEINLNTMLLL